MVTALSSSIPNRGRRVKNILRVIIFDLINRGCKIHYSEIGGNNYCK